MIDMSDIEFKPQYLDNSRTCRLEYARLLEGLLDKIIPFHNMKYIANSRHHKGLYRKDEK